MAWRIECKPEGHNPGTEEGRNEGGMVVYVVAGAGGREEIGRVAFERQNSTHPDVTYGDQLDTFMTAARETISMMESLRSEAGVLQ
jgi:hypothetical protein